MRSKRSHFFKEIHRVVIRNLTFETGLQNKHNNYYALVIKDKVIKDQRQSKKRTKKHKNFHAPVMKEQVTTAQKIEQKI